MNRPSTITRIAATTGIVLGAFALSALATWTPPHSTPTTCITDPANANYDEGCNPPINVGGSQQTKTGLLSLGYLQFLPPLFGNTTGMSLIATDANGTVGWGPAASGAGVPSNIVVFDVASALDSTGVKPLWVSGSNGNYTIVVPANVTKMRVMAWGGGGGGGRASGAGGSAAGGGGGGYAENVVSVTSGASIKIVIGSGGLGHTVRTVGGAGGLGAGSLFGGFGSSGYPGPTVGGGGGGGGSDDGNQSNPGGVGGASNIGALLIAGGNGQGGKTSGDVGGAGGSSPNGGQGGISDQSSANGQAPGGGGGGSGASDVVGGNGANGRIIIEY